MPTNWTRSNPLFQHAIVIGGQIAGTWKRTLGKNAVTLETHPFAQLKRAENRAVELAARRYGEFLESRLILVNADPGNVKRSAV